MPYLIVNRNNSADTQLVDDADLAYAQSSGYSVVRYVSDADADAMAQQGTASSVGPQSFQPVGYDPTAPQTHAAAADAVNFANAATNRTNAETNYLSTLGSQFLEARGPKNLFQFENAMIGQPKATIPAWATALKGMGELVYSPIADADRNALKLSDFVRGGKTQTSVGPGGGDAVTQQRAGASTGGGQAGVKSDATSQAQPRGYGQTGQVWSPEMGRWVDATHAATGYYGLLAPQTAAVSQVAGVANPLGVVAPMTYPPLEGGLGRAGGGDPSDIAWKRKYHALVAGLGYGHGSAAREAANAAAGISEEQASHAIRHGQNPYAGATHAATGYSGVARSGADLPLPPGTGYDPANASGGFTPPGVQYPGDGLLPGAAQPAPPPAAGTTLPLYPAQVGGQGGGFPGSREYAPPPAGGATSGAYGPAPAPATHPTITDPRALPAPDYHPHVGVGSNPTGGPVVAGGGAPTHAAAAAAGARASGRPAAIAAQQAEYERLMRIASHWYAHQFGTDLGTAATDLQSQDPDTQAYLRAALGMARAGEIQAQLGLDDQGNPIARTAAPAPPAAAPSPWHTMTPEQQAAAVAQTTNQRGGAGIPTDAGTAGRATRYVAANNPMGRANAVPLAGGAPLPPGYGMVNGLPVGGRVTGGATDPFSVLRGGAPPTPDRPGQNVQSAPWPVHAAGGFAGALPAMPPDAGVAPPNGSPDLSALMGGGGAPPSGMPDPGMGGPMPMDTGMGGGLDPTNPEQPPEALQQIAMILQQPPAPTDGPLEQAVRENWTLGHDGMPHFVGTAAQGAQQATALAQGGSFVVTDPTAFTVNGQPFVTGEQGRDELVRAQPVGQGATRLQVVPLQRPGMAVPAWAASRANALVPGSPYHAGVPAGRLTYAGWRPPLTQQDGMGQHDQGPFRPGPYGGDASAPLPTAAPPSQTPIPYPQPFPQATPLDETMDPSWLNPLEYAEWERTHRQQMATGGTVVVPAWTQAPIFLASGGEATVYGSGSPSVLYGGSTVTNAATPVKGNTGISETGQVRVANRGRGYSTRPTPLPYVDPNRMNPIVMAQIAANPTLKATAESGWSSLGLDPASTWAAFYSSLPRQNPGTATRLAGAY